MEVNKAIWLSAILIAFALVGTVQAATTYTPTQNWVAGGKNVSTVNSPTWTNEGDGDGYYSLNGANQYLNVGNFLSNYTSSDPWAFAVRFKSDADEWTRFLRWRYDYSNTKGNQMGIDSAGRLTVIHGQTFTSSSNASAYYTVGVWGTAIFEWTGTRLLMYQDCTVVYNNTATMYDGADTSDYVRDTLIGTEETDGTNSFDGDLDFVLLRLGDTFTASERTALCADQAETVYEPTDQFFFAFFNGTVYSQQNVTANFASVVGSIKDYAYGTNTHGIWGGTSSWIDTNHDGTLDTASNYTEHREKYDQAGMQTLRADFYLESSSSLTSFSNSTFNNANVENRRSMVEYAASTGKEFVGIASYMPTWLSDNASTCSSDHTRCAPSNYTTYGQLVVNYLDAIDCDLYQSNCAVEVWNEPDLATFLLPDGTCAQRASVYVQLYDAVEAAVRAAYPSIKVYVGAVADSGTGACGHTVLSSVLGNASSLGYTFDKVSIHGHLPEDGTNMDNRFNFVIGDLLSLCSSSGVSCPQILFSEASPYATSKMVGNDSGYEFELNLGWIEAFGTYPANISFHLYQWQEECAYGNYGCYDEYPKNFEAYSEALLSNTQYVPFNFTANWTDRHPSRSKVVSVTKSGDTPLLCTNNTAAGQSTGYFCTLASDLSEDVEVQLTLSGISATNITNLRNGSIYNVSGGVVNLGVVPAQSFQYYQINGVSSYSESGPTISGLLNYSNKTYFQVNFSCNEDCNASVNYGTSTALGNRINESAFISSHSIDTTAVSPSTVYYYNLTVCNSGGFCTTEGPYTFTTNQNPTVNNVSILPGTGSISEDLGGYCSIEDGDGDDITYYGHWWNGSTLYSTAGTQSVVSSPTSAGASYDGWNAITLGLYGRAKWVGLVESYENFNFDVPSASTVSNISVTIQTDCGTSGANVDLGVAVSIDGGSTWGTTHTLTAPSLSGACSGHTETITGIDWGLGSVQGSDMSDANFAVRVNKTSGGDGLTTTFSDLDVSFSYDIVEAAGTQVLVDTIETSELADGETWTFTCWGSDGTANSTYTNSSSVMITDDSVPQISMYYQINTGLAFIEYTPSHVTPRQTANLYANITEESIAIVNVTLSKGNSTWFANMVYTQIAGYGSELLDAYYYAFNETESEGTYDYTVTVEDSSGNTNTFNSSFLVSNNPTGSGGGGAPPPSVDPSGGSAGSAVDIDERNVTFQPSIPLINTFKFMWGDYQEQQKRYVINTNKKVDSCAVVNIDSDATYETVSCYVIDNSLYVDIVLTDAQVPFSRVYRADVLAVSSEGESMTVPIKLSTFSFVVEDETGALLITKVVGLIVAGLFAVYVLRLVFSSRSVRVRR